MGIAPRPSNPRGNVQSIKILGVRNKISERDHALVISFLEQKLISNQIWCFLTTPVHSVFQLITKGCRFGSRGFLCYTLISANFEHFLTYQYLKFVVNLKYVR